jgi:hypothetical protein
LKDQWIGKHVDLDLLSQQIQHFFAANRFQTRMEKKADRCKIAAVPQDTRVPFRIQTNIIGRPNDFTVEFIPNKKTSGFASWAMVFGHLTSVFGGGSLLLRDVKLQEALSKLEQIFWDHVDKSVADLANSAQASL